MRKKIAPTAMSEIVDLTSDVEESQLTSMWNNEELSSHSSVEYEEFDVSCRITTTFLLHLTVCIIQGFQRMHCNSSIHGRGSVSMYGIENDE